MKTFATKRNLSLLAILLLVMGVFIYGATGPYRTMNAIKSAIDNGDQIALDDNIDFAKLKQSLRDQVTASMAKSAAEEKDGMNALATGFATLFMDKMLDSLVTPAGLAKLSSGSSLAPADSNDDQSEVDSKDMFKDARYKFDSMSTFSAYVPNDDGKEARFVLKRDGLHWKLCFIIVPMDDPADTAEPESKNMNATQNAE